MPSLGAERADRGCPANIAWILRDSGASLLLVESHAQWQANEPIHEDLRRVRRIVALEPLGDPTANARPIDAWLEPEGREFHCERLSPDTPATLVYTSGTTGRPKGVVLSHCNIL